ncbi:aldo/keto reductase [Persicitalea sp.]|uniref:aldo/keto reductase n=1 Tax=Persicitalea sp. TaxID=3100273 RepID=UPI003593D535
MNSTRSKIILGTVQFGLDYGINNSQGRPDPQRVFDILDLAFAQGVRILDSADAYGNAPEIIGRYHQSQAEKFDIITKFKSGPHFEAEEWLSQQLGKFGVQRLYAAMFHDFQDYQANRSVISDFEKLVQDGSIGKIGVSIYTNHQLAEAIADPSISLIQLPYNLLDNHSQRGELLAKAKAAGKEVHVRSVFLQGLFFVATEDIPEKLVPLKPELEALGQLASRFGVPLESMALNYAVINPHIDHVLIGVDTPEQLQANLSSLAQTLPPELIETLDRIKVKDVALLNPTNWK